MTKLFSYQGLIYKQGVHGFFYYLNSGKWFKSCNIDETVLRAIDRKSDPLSLGDNRESRLNDENGISTESLVNRMAYLEWRNGGDLSPRDISTIITRALGSVKKELSNESKKRNALFDNMSMFSERMQKMIIYYYSDTDLNLINVARKFNLSVEHTRGLFRAAIKRTKH